MSDIESLEQVRRLEHGRLHPSLTNPNWLILRARRELFTKWFGAIPGEKLRVLDVGGRLQPYRSLLGNRCEKYVAVDLRQTPLVNAIGRAEQLPFADELFDIVICTQVLEYLPDPRRAIREMHRVLRPCGFLVLSVPSVFPRDSDVEYWRFLRSSLEDMLSCFSKIEIAAEGNSMIGFVRTIAVCTVSLARPAVLSKILCFTMVPVLNVLGLLMQGLISKTDDRFTANFSAIAQK